MTVGLRADRRIQAMILTVHWRNSAVKGREEVRNSWKVKWDHEKAVKGRN